jgi:hypothetical protein
MMPDGLKTFFTPEEEEEFIRNFSWRRAGELINSIRSPVSETMLGFFEERKKKLEEVGEGERAKKIGTLLEYVRGSHKVELDPIDEEILKIVEEKAVKKEEVSRAELMALEDILCKASSTWNLSVEREKKLREFISETARQDFEAGIFGTYQEALVHYGLQKEAEEADG